MKLWTHSGDSHALEPADLWARSECHPHWRSGCLGPRARRADRAGPRRWPHVRAAQADEPRRWTRSTCDSRPWQRVARYERQGTQPTAGAFDVRIRLQRPRRGGGLGRARLPVDRAVGGSDTGSGALPRGRQGLQRLAEGDVPGRDAAGRSRRRGFDPLGRGRGGRNGPGGGDGIQSHQPAQRARTGSARTGTTTVGSPCGRPPRRPGWSWRCTWDRMPKHPTARTTVPSKVRVAR